MSKNEQPGVIPLAPPSEAIPRGVQIVSIAGREKRTPVERSTPTAALVSGTVVAGKFALIREIASGGMGTVFEAHDMLVDRVVALKLMHPYLNAKPEIVARFIREAQAAARIRHPNVVAILEMGKRRDGTFYIVQEMLMGRTLREHLDECGKLEPAEAVTIAIPILGGLAAAHASRIIHRDVKPENIILWHAPSGERVPKLIDFGIAKATSDGARLPTITHYGALVGTPHYMSPEQAWGHAVDVRTDIWAMGVVLFEMLAGQTPFDGETSEEILMKIRMNDPPRIEDVVPSAAAFGSVISKALQRSSDGRFATMQQMREALERIEVRATSVVVAKEPVRPDAMALTLPFAALDAAQEIVLDVSDLEPISFEAEPPTLRAQEMADDVNSDDTRLFASDEVSAKLGRSSSESAVVNDPLHMAERALDINALRDAIASTDLGLLMPGLSSERCGKIWLIRSVAQRWLGEYEQSARAGEEAMRRLVPGGTDWQAAFGHFVISHGHLGNHDRLVRAVDQLRTVEEDNGGMTTEHIVSACRLTIFTLRLGLYRIAKMLFDRAQRYASMPAEHPPFMHAWVSVARAEFALHGGDLTANLRHVYSAVEGFTSAGDVRNAALQRANIGNAFLQLGGYEYACGIFEETLRVAEPMQLDFVASANANLVMTLANLQRFDAACAAADTALLRARTQGNRRCEAVTLVYLARIRALMGDVSGASKAAADAERQAEQVPAVRAYALAFGASMQLQQRQAASAEKLVQESVRIVEHLQGIEEGESLIRLTHALVLRERGQRSESKRVLKDARTKLLERAERISDAGWRKSFLTNVPDNRELLRVADQWLGAP